MIGYKCARHGNGLALVKLKIDGLVIRGDELGAKMRTSKATVLEIRKINVKRSKGYYETFTWLQSKCRQWIPGIETNVKSRTVGKKLESAYSDADHHFSYEVGKTVVPKADFNRSMSTCASGIHFFLSKTTAIRYLDS